jgi:spermidine synthase
VPTPPDETPHGRRLATADGAAGELALLERDGHLELVANGVFLLDTRGDGASERALVRAAVEAADRPVRRLLLGGLGFGYSLAEARALGVDEVVVVEREPAVVAWNREHTGARSGGSVTDPGVEVVTDDLVAWLRQEPAAAGRFDAICLDVDNGPDWVVTPGNAWLYEEDGSAALHTALAPGGVLAVWSATAATAYAERLATRFRWVRRDEHATARGGPDVVVLAGR